MTAKIEASKPFYATRTFKDAGTGKSFEGGSVIEAAAGEIGNYEAAGLASREKPKVSDAQQIVADARDA